MAGILGITGAGGLAEDLFGYDPIEPAFDELYGDTNDYYNFLKLLISGGNDGLTGGLVTDEPEKGGVLSGVLGDLGNLQDLLGGAQGAGLGITDGSGGFGGLLADLLGEDPVGPLLIDLGLEPVNAVLNGGGHGLLGSVVDDLGGGLGGLEGLLGSLAI